MRPMIKVNITLDTHSPITNDVLAQLLRDNPGARLYLRHLLSVAFQRVLKDFTGLDSVFTVSESTVRGYDAVGNKPEKRHSTMRRIEVPDHE